MAGFFVYINVVQHSAGLGSYALPGHQVRVVFCDGDEDVVAFLEVSLPVRASDDIQRLTGISGVNDFSFALGMDEVLHHFFRRVIGFRCGNREKVCSSVGVPIFMEHIVSHRIHNRKRPLGGGGVIKINDFAACHFCM